jgi:uncharacterized protein YjiS (DUF1127 family)
MSVCIEHNYQNNQLSNISQSLPGCTKTQIFPNWDMVSIISVWLERSRQRKQLASLDEHLLNDIGYTREQARIEYSKPFWK